MPHVSKDDASQVEQLEGEFEGRYEQLGEIMIGFETYYTEADVAPLFAGLPDDACQSPHWGYVLRGKVTFRSTDGTEETVHAGQAYVVPPGHTPVFHPDTELVEFSPAEEFARTVEVVTRNAEAMGS